MPTELIYISFQIYIAASLKHPAHFKIKGLTTAISRDFFQVLKCGLQLSSRRYEYIKPKGCVVIELQQV
jgi:hypothetical protein